LTVGDVVDHKGRFMECLNVQQFHHAQGKGIVEAALRDLKDGRRLEVKWRSRDEVEVAELQNAKYHYVGVNDEDEDLLQFEDAGGEVHEFDKEFFGSKAAYFTEGAEIYIKSVEEELLAFSLMEPMVECEVKSTPPGGGQVQPTFKVAVLTNNVKIKVPPFIQKGDKIIVNTDSGEYVSKVK